MLTQTVRQSHTLVRSQKPLLRSLLIQFKELTPASSLNGLTIIPTASRHAGPIVDEMPPPPARKNFRESLLPDDWAKYIERYPEFLPDPIIRNPFITMRLIDDMLERRKVIEIPEFYVGSVLAVTCSDPFAETKKTRFVGICVQRSGQMHWANFTLRNCIDGMGVEIRYDLYNPMLLSIEVLRFEKRLDDHLLYLRDALPEYSTFPQDMKPEPYDEDAEPPLNKLQVKMKPFPWHRRWERHFLKGVEKLENVPQLFHERAKQIEEDPVYSYDLMLEYRRHCTEEQVYNICKRLAEHERDVVQKRKEARSLRFLRIARTPTVLHKSASKETSDDQKTTS